MMKSTLVKLMLACVALCLSCGGMAAEKLNVTFINPGKSDEAYWKMVTAFMKASAQDLGINLEVLWAERDHFQQVKFGEEIAARAKKPDYVVVVNEKLVAPQTIKPLDKAGIKTFLILNDLTDEQKKTDGGPRGTYKNWIGTMIPDNVDAGYKIAKSLFADAAKKGFGASEMVAISGNRATPASVERKQGLDKALKESKEYKLNQEVWSEFEEGKAYEQTKGLLQKFPATKLIWAANDPMAFGAMKAVKELGKVPGKDILIGGLNWSTPALKAVHAGEMAVTVGGHFMCGGWSLVAIYDYANGSDFAKDNGLEMKPEVFGAIDASNVDTYMANYGDENWSKIDFAKFSRKLNPSLQHYDFGVNAVIKNVKVR